MHDVGGPVGLHSLYLKDTASIFTENTAKYNAHL